jgi:hypothetical protein
MTKPVRAFVVDVANILFRCAAMQKIGDKSHFARGAEQRDLVGLSMHVSLLSINKWYRKYPCDLIVFAFEGSNNWRKRYTADNSTQVRMQYKANRVPDPEMQHFFELMDSFKTIISEHTSIICLTADGMEGDDMIGGYCELHPEQDITILSGDKDYIQLLRRPNIRLVNPDNGKLRNQPGDKDYEADIDYWMFLKCVRGDSGDNVPSAYPRVRETKIKEAYNDPYHRLNFMNELWQDPLSKVEHKVGDLFKHNEVLMDLTKQPPEIKTKLHETIKFLVDPVNQKRYSHFHFLRFLAKFDLMVVTEKINFFMDMFTHNTRYRKGQLLLTESSLPERGTKHVEPPANPLLEF